MQRFVLAALVVSAFACRKAPPAQAPAPVPAPDQAQDPAPKALVLTDAKLDAWFVYERKLIDLGGDFRGSLPKTGAYQGNLGAARAADEIVQAQGRASQAAEAALKEAKLTQEEANQIQELTYRVMMKKQLAASSTALLKQMEAARAAAPPEQQKEIEDSLAEARRSNAETINFTEEKAKYGAAAVALVLAREAAWTKLMAHAQASHAK